MHQAAAEFDRARGQMAGDLKTMITDSEELLKAAATVSGQASRRRATSSRTT